jgi:hypothetical protein
MRLEGTRLSIGARATGLKRNNNYLRWIVGSTTAIPEVRIHRAPDFRDFIDACD